MVAAEAAQKEMAIIKLRRLLARPLVQSHGGQTGVLGKVNWESALRRRGPVAILEIDASGAMAKFQGQTLKVARYRVRGQCDPKDAGGAKWNPVPGRMAVLAEIPSATSGKKTGNDGPLSDGGEECSETSTAPPRARKHMGRGSDSASPAPVAVLVPSSPIPPI